jgi:ADP-heptose:LPS heptosyltransferase
LTDVVPDRGYGIQHEADYWLEVVGLAGATNPCPRLEIAIEPEVERRAARLLGGTSGGTSYVALYPGSGRYSPARRWPAERFGRLGARLARELSDAADVQVLVVGGPGEERLGDEVCARIGPAALNLAERTPDLKTLAAVLRRCALFVGNDGGVMHVAVAAGTPVVAVFGPSNHVSWGPYGGATWPVDGRTRPNALVVRQELPCAPCLYRGFLPGTPHGCRARDCLGLVSEDHVFAAARYLWT